MEIHLDNEKWFQSFRRSDKGIMNTSLIEANIKIFTRWYYIPTRLARIYPDASPLCYRGCNRVGSMYHTWTYPYIKNYWNKFFQILGKVTGVTVSQDPTIALLNHRVDKTPKHTQTLIFFMFLGTKIMLARAWKKPTVSIPATKAKISWIMSKE